MPWEATSTFFDKSNYHRILKYLLQLVIFTVLFSPPIKLPQNNFSASQGSVRRGWLIVIPKTLFLLPIRALPLAKT